MSRSNVIAGSAGVALETLLRDRTHWLAWARPPRGTRLVRLD